MKPRPTTQARTETARAKRKISNAENIPNSFLDNVRPIILMLRLFGRFPYDISENEIQPFSKTSPIAVYSLLLLAISLYFASVVLDLLTHKLATSESYKDTLISITAISYLIHYPLIPFTGWLLAPTLIKNINLWHRYECQFNEEFVSLPNKYLIRFLSYSSWPVSIYLSYQFAFEVCSNSFLCSMMFFPLIICLYQYALLWTLCQFYIVRQIKKLKEVVKSDGLQKVERTRRCWLLLSELASCTGCSIGLVLTSAGMTYFLGLIIYCYVFFTSLLDPEGSVEWQMGFMTALHFLIIFFLFDSAERATNEVGRHFFLVVFDQKFSQLDEENTNQLVLLLTTFSLHPPVVRMAGFSVANRQLFVSFVSNTLTYIIVLVQIKI